MPLGALSRSPVRTAAAAGRAEGPRTVAVLLGTGGHDVPDRAVSAARAATPDWRWHVMDGRPDTWVEDPAPVLAAADVVVTHAGQNALAETAAARRPAVVLPQVRPHDEQVTTGQVLRSGWPAVVVDRWPEEGWAELLESAAALDGSRWAEWCDGHAADRFADVVAGFRAAVAVGG